MTDAMEDAALLCETAAAELDRAAAHCRTAAAHFREREIPRAAAHAWAAFGQSAPPRRRSRHRRRPTLRGRTRCEHYWLIDAVALAAVLGLLGLRHEDLQSQRR